MFFFCPTRKNPALSISCNWNCSGIFYPAMVPFWHHGPRKSLRFEWRSHSWAKYSWHNFCATYVFLIRQSDFYHKNASFDKRRRRATGCIQNNGDVFMLSHQLLSVTSPYTNYRLETEKKSLWISITFPQRCSCKSLKIFKLRLSRS